MLTVSSNHQNGMGFTHFIGRHISTERFIQNDTFSSTVKLHPYSAICAEHTLHGCERSAAQAVRSSQQCPIIGASRFGDYVSHYVSAANTTAQQSNKVAFNVRRSRTPSTAQPLPIVMAAQADSTGRQQPIS